MSAAGAFKQWKTRPTDQPRTMHEGATTMSGTFDTGADGEAPRPMTHPAPSRAEADGDRAANERIVVLVILRGLALVGMFMVHFNYYEATPLGAEPGRAAAFVERALGLFFDERFYGIFGMLFGVGFAIQLERSASHGRPFVARYLRRLAALAVFGFIAMSDAPASGSLKRTCFQFLPPSVVR